MKYWHTFVYYDEVNDLLMTATIENLTPPDKMPPTMHFDSPVQAGKVTSHLRKSWDHEPTELELDEVRPDGHKTTDPDSPIYGKK